MSHILSKTIFSLSMAAGAIVAGTAGASPTGDHATLAQNEQAARNAIVQPAPSRARHDLARPLVMSDTTPATLAINEAAARRAIVDPPVRRSAEAVSRSYGQKATLSQNERAARRAISQDARDRDDSIDAVALESITRRQAGR